MSGKYWNLRLARALGMALPLALCASFAGAIGVPPVAADATSATPRFSSAEQLGENASSEALRAAHWALEAGDAKGQPFAVVDKKQARLYVFDADGHLAGATAVLLGQALGDESAPGVGYKVTSGIPTNERTTPAGRFASQPGRNITGEAIVWVDYDAAIAIHRLRPAPPAQRRPQRLASDSVEDKRISLGCIVVPPAFYDTIVAATLGRQRGVVYVLPDTRSWDVVFKDAPPRDLPSIAAQAL